LGILKDRPESNEPLLQGGWKTYFGRRNWTRVFQKEKKKKRERQNSDREKGDFGGIRKDLKIRFEPIKENKEVSDLGKKRGMHPPE